MTEKDKSTVLWSITCEKLKLPTILREYTLWPPSVKKIDPISRSI